MTNEKLIKGDDSSNSRRKFLGKFGTGSLLVGLSGTGLASNTIENTTKKMVRDVYAFGAKGDGKTVDTKAIQAAIDDCFKSGGGKVVLHNGTFVSGTIILKDNVNLHVEAGAILLGSPTLKDYPDITPKILYQYTHRFTRYLIYADGANHISITGRGTIDGQGRAFPYDRDDDKGRPYIIRFAECKNVTVRDITFLDSARWLQHYLACENVNVDGITVIAKTRENRDGIDIDSCDNFRVANCYIDSGDDAIVLKATAMRPCKNVTVSNCHLRSLASTLKLGTESNGGFENILFTGCSVQDAGDAIALEMVDGGKFENITVSNIVIKKARNAIFVRLGDRARPIPGIEKPGKGSMSNIVIDNIQAYEVSDWGCSVTGLADQIVKNVTLSNIRIQFKGGGTLEDAKKSLPEKPDAYPSSSMFGKLPVYGFFCRHLKNLNLNNINIDTEIEDKRAPLYCEDINGLNVTDFNAVVSADAEAYIIFRDIKNSMIRTCRPDGTSKAFLKVKTDEFGESGTENIAIFNNDLSQVQETIAADNIIGQKIIVRENIMKNK
jgi:polygalacturonase